MRPLENAIKQNLTNYEDKGFAMLKWSDNYYTHIYRMPIDAIDKILEWRDKEYKNNKE